LKKPESSSSLLGQLQHASQFELNEIIEKILRTDFPLDEFAKLVERKMDAGAYVTNNSLTSLILKSRSPSLYARSRTQLWNDDWSLVSLYQERYPDPDLEPRLCERLYEVAFKDGEPRRRAIVDAMAQVGTKAVLPTLEAILTRVEPSAKVRELFADSLGLIQSLEAKSRADFVKRVALAIEQISARSSAEPPSEERTSGSDAIRNAQDHYTTALKWSEQYPETAVIYLRKGAEALAKDLYRRLGHEKNGKPARKMTLDELMKPVQESTAIPELIKIMLRSFQAFGNFAAHDQDGQSVTLTKEATSALIQLYGETLAAYKTWPKDM